MSLEAIKSGGSFTEVWWIFKERVSIYSKNRVKPNVCLFLSFVCTKIDLCLFARKKIPSMIKRFRH